MTSKNNSQFVPRDNTGVLFYDAPGVPTLKGSVQMGQKIEVTAEPGVDSQQRQYTRIKGNNVSGALYPNEHKSTDNHPDFTGPITVKGEELRVAAWTRQKKSGADQGQDYLSLSISAKQARN